jgi:C4-dicarboxylate-specific signal transduction histidine kinase
VPIFLRHLAARLREENEMLVNEVGGLRKNVEHIKEIVAMQQGFADVVRVLETLKPEEIIDDALLIHASSLAGARIEVRREYDPAVGEITVDKHKLLQILVNLISNARNACYESTQPRKEIILGLQRKSGNVQITVQDNGIGITPENLARIFGFGFTTRKEGHGFGLHSSSLAAKEMGGQLTVYSAGQGQGARFTLELGVASPVD